MQEGAIVKCRTNRSEEAGHLPCGRWEANASSAPMWHPPYTHVAPSTHPCGTHYAPLWHPPPCTHVAPTMYPCGTHVLMWHPPYTHVAPTYSCGTHVAPTMYPCGRWWREVWGGGRGLSLSTRSAQLASTPNYNSPPTNVCPDSAFLPSC